MRLDLGSVRNRIRVSELFYKASMSDAIWDHFLKMDFDDNDKLKISPMYEK